MAAIRASNIKCRSLVQARKEFQGHNLYGTQVGKAYVVYSYGPHFPLFAYIDGKWYEHEERASVSTSKQRGQAHPLADMVTLPDAGALKLVISAANR